MNNERRSPRRERPRLFLDTFRSPTRANAINLKLILNLSSKIVRTGRTIRAPVFCRVKFWFTVAVCTPRDFPLRLLRGNSRILLPRANSANSSGKVAAGRKASWARDKKKKINLEWDQKGKRRGERYIYTCRHAGCIVKIYSMKK
ncbi:hypothetical protein PUN28_019090 [Cardiocondyla obscurior]|uniref:Uncharacterized protein n=1 Tax=Cardiocondyla obscurior TaxID=286306 RepID=A0AAW2EJ72_9HYME